MTQRIINKCSIVGILEDGEKNLNQQAVESIKQADVLIGNPRFMGSIQHLLKNSVEKKNFSGHVMQVPDWVQIALQENKHVVVLATGDPLCHGIGSFITKKLGIEKCDFIPNVSMFQIAFSRLGLAWQSVKISSIHTKDMGEWTENAPLNHAMRPLLKDCRDNDLIAIYTSPENSPKRIAKMLIIEQLNDDFEILIASGLTTKQEELSAWLNIQEVKSYKYKEPNLVILRRLQASALPVLIGLSDNRYAQRKPGGKGLITKQEIRAVSLAKMQLHADSIVWDIGAGSGSIGLECANLCSKGFVHAIEKNEVDYAIIQENLILNSFANYHIELAKAPQGLENWQDPDAIFIGGSGGNLAELIQLCLLRLKNHGTLVMNFITLENLNSACETLKQAEFIEWDYIQMQVSRSKPILKMHRLQAENPVYIVSARKLNDFKDKDKHE